MTRLKVELFLSCRLESVQVRQLGTRVLLKINDPGIVGFRPQQEGRQPSIKEKQNKLGYLVLKKERWPTSRKGLSSTFLSALSHSPFQTFFVCVCVCLYPSSWTALWKKEYAKGPGYIYPYSYTYSFLYSYLYLSMCIYWYQTNRIADMIILAKMARHIEILVSQSQILQSKCKMCNNSVSPCIN